MLSGLKSDAVDVQENSARAVAYAIEQEGNLKDLRKMGGIVTLIEMLAALPDTDRAPNDKVGLYVDSVGSRMACSQL